jgi:predicted enzyme related to lactoylglutathione lyase
MAAGDAKGRRKMPRSENDCRIDYVELVVADIARSKAFYGGAFGWTFTDYGETYCEFADGRLKGGFTTGGKPRPGGPLIVLYGDDLDDLVERVRAAGGQISKPPFDFPGGRRFHFVDPDGYELAIWSKRS